MQINEIIWPSFFGSDKIDLKLKNVRNFLKKIDNPHLNIKNIIHVAGTNGKGSTIAFLSSFLRAAGYSVNCYTSPHLVEFNERITLNDQHINDSDLQEILEFCQQQEKSCQEKLTFFEGTTIAAILAFTKFKADFNIFETGLGGRLDATNIFDQKELAIITAISLDHQEYLGDDIISIAKEKLAITKTANQTIIANQSRLLDDFLDKNYLVKDFIYAKDQNFEVAKNKIALTGGHQKENFHTAYIAATKLIGSNKTKLALESYHNYFLWRGRLEQISHKNIISKLAKDSKVFLDGGHNIAAAKILANFLKINSAKYEHIYLVANQTKDRDIKAFMNEFKDIKLNFLSYHFNHQREFYAKEELEQIFLGKYLNGYDNFDEIWRLDKGNSLFLICGSLFLAGEFLQKYI